jgi:signal transduction histidine kinase
VYAYFSRNYVGTPMLHFWLGAVIAIAAARVYWQARWSSPRPRTPAEVKRATWGLYLLAAFSAATWGIGGALLLDHESFEHFAITVFILAGLAAGAAGAYGADLRLSVIFLTLLLFPFIGRLVVLGGTPFISVGLLALVYLAILFLVIVNGNRHVRHSIEIGLDNEDLVHRLSQASHEIRTPVSTISGFADILADQEEMHPSARQYAQIIRRNCSYLKRLVDNVLILSRAEAGVSDEVWESVRLRDQISLALDVIRTRAHQKNLWLKAHYSDNVPERARLQSTKFQQILINLLTNAVKFTNEGGIDVNVRLSREAELIIQVVDTGIGIKKENVERVFQVFFRENRDGKSSAEGSGLGLALARSLAQSMGGDLYLANRCEAGCTFELKIPLVV